MFNKIISFLLSHFMSFWAWTTDMIVIAPSLEALEQTTDRGGLLAFWHDQQIPVVWAHKHIFHVFSERPIHALISRHNDGRLAANVLRHYGIKSIDGSSSSGGTEALLQMKTLLNQRVTLGITPDGPRGPKHIAKRGVAKLALLTDTPIYCVAVSASRAWYFKSWDQMFIPKPFSKVIVIFDRFKFDPTMTTSQKKAEGQLAEQLTLHLNKLTELAKKHLNS